MIRRLFIGVLLVGLIMSLFSCASQQARPAPSEVQVSDWTMVNGHNFFKEVIDYPGYAVVLFYNDKYWQSRDMERRFEKFAGEFAEAAKFCKFHWPIHADAASYSLEILPTTVLYRDGQEIDRIRGIPPEEEDRIDWNADLELWLLQNVAELKTDQYSADYIYRFNNTYELNISNY